MEALIPIIASVAGAAISSGMSQSATDQATSTSSDATQAAIAVQQQAMLNAQRMFAPWYGMGAGALGAMGWMLGVNPAQVPSLPMYGGGVGGYGYGPGGPIQPGYGPGGTTPVGYSGYPGSPAAAIAAAAPAGGSMFGLGPTPLQQEIMNPGGLPTGTLSDQLGMYSAITGNDPLTPDVLNNMLMSTSMGGGYVPSTAGTGAPYSYLGGGFGSLTQPTASQLGAMNMGLLPAVQRAEDITMTPTQQQATNLLQQPFVQNALNFSTDITQLPSTQAALSPNQPGLNLMGLPATQAGQNLMTLPGTQAGQNLLGLPAVANALNPANLPDLQNQQDVAFARQLTQALPGQLTLSGQALLDQDPGYAFRLQQGEQAIGTAEAAMGLGLSSANLRSLGRYAEDYASSEYQNAWQRNLQSRLSPVQEAQSMAGIGLGAAETGVQESLAQAGLAGNLATQQAQTTEGLALGQGQFAEGLANQQFANQLQQGQFGADVNTRQLQNLIAQSNVGTQALNQSFNNQLNWQQLLNTLANTGMLASQYSFQNQQNWNAQLFDMLNTLNQQGYGAAGTMATGQTGLGGNIASNILGLANTTNAGLLQNAANQAGAVGQMVGGLSRVNWGNLLGGGTSGVSMPAATDLISYSGWTG
jgi:hypothetical protein